MALQVSKLKAKTPGRPLVDGCSTGPFTWSSKGLWPNTKLSQKYISSKRFLSLLVAPQMVMNVQE